MATREYLNFDPVTDLIHGDDCDTLLVSLPDFSKEQLKVQFSPSGSLKISGERPIEGNKWSRFSKEFPVSSNCDTTKMTANFRLGILYVQQPKLIISAEKKEKLENKPFGSNNEPPKYQKPKDGQEKLENKPSGNNEPLKSQKPKDDQEKFENKSSGSNEPLKSQPQNKNQETNTMLHKDGQSKPHKTNQGTGQTATKPKDEQEKLENKPSGSNEPLKTLPQKKNQETARLHKDGQSDKTNQGTMTKPKDDQLTQLQKGAQEADQITNPMRKQKDQKLGNAFGDLPKKETVASEVPEKSSSKEDEIKEIVGNEKNESKYEEDEYEQAINRAMMVGQPSRWMNLVLVVLFIAFVWFHLMNGTTEGSEN